MEAEMPERRVGLHLLPRLETGDRDVENHHATCGLWVETSERIGDHAAVVVAFDVGRLHPEMEGELVNVLRERRGVVRTRGWRGSTNPAEIHGDHRKRASQPRHDSAKHGPVLGKPVKQDDRRTGAAANIVERRRVHVHRTGDEPVTELRKGGIDRCPTRRLFR